jgi:hypothetical protein
MNSYGLSVKSGQRLRTSLIGLIGGILLIATVADAQAYRPRHGHRGHGPSFTIFASPHYPYYPPYPYHYQPPRTVAVTPAVTKRLYVYPQRSQTAEQQHRDEYDCYRWAAGQTGFDPVSVAPPATLITGSPPPDGLPGNPVTGTVGGAALGAAGGALAGDAATGAAVGAALGLVAGMLGQSNNQGPRQVPVAGAPTTGGGGEYQRAFSTCLAGRGYQVG